MFNTDTIHQLARTLNEPSWITDIRRNALARHLELPWPHPSDDVWRRMDVSLLDPSRGFAPVSFALRQSIRLAESQLSQLTHPLGDELLFVRANGAWVSRAQAKGLAIEELSEAAQRRPDTIRPIIESDGLSEPEQKLSSLNTAFHHDDVVVQIPANYVGTQPVRLVHLLSARPKQALFPMTLIHVGAGSSVLLVDEYVSVGEAGSDERHLVNGRIELVLEPDARVQYIRLQRWDLRAREFLLAKASIAKGATLTMANLNLGASVSKAHLITRLTGEQATTRLFGFVFGHGSQHVDQHTLQDHRAPHTDSDLQFRAALQDKSRMVYTGLIRIAPEAKETHAYQANHNLMLSESAKAETIPMLEILADDVQCKHGASIGPIDEEQTFYLTSRGIPREVAQRLIVMGFIEPIIQQIPFGPLQDRLREDIEGGLQQS